MMDKVNQGDFKRCGLAVVKHEPVCSADFLFASFVSESLKDGRIVIYVSGNRSAESFKIASNKMAVRLDAQRFHFIELSSMMDYDLHGSIESKVLERIDSVSLGGSVLIVLDNIQLLSCGSLRDEIAFIVDIKRRLNAESLLMFGTHREIAEYCFRFPLQFNISPIGSGFGKKVTGQIEVVSYKKKLDTLPVLSSFHYSIGERSIQMFYPGTASIL